MSDQNPINPTPKAELTPDEMRRFATAMMEEASKLFAKAQGADAVPAAETPTKEPETLVRFHKDEIGHEGYLSFESQRRRKAWLLIGLLTDSGLIEMPNFDAVGDAAKIATCEYMNWLYEQIDGALELMDKA